MDYNTQIRRNSHSAFQVADGKAVVMLADNSNIFTLNEKGTEIWNLLDTPKTVEEILTALLSVYGENQRATIEKDVIEFLTSSLKERIIELT